MTNILRNNSEKRAFWCKWYCDGWKNWKKRICNANCRKLNEWGDRSEVKFQYTKEEKEKARFIVDKYRKYVKPENLNNYLFVAEINKKIENILNKPKKLQLDIFNDELY